jgi:hypothetical protein
MRVDRRVSPNQTAIWTVYELCSGAGQRPTVVRLACYYGRSTGVNGRQPSRSRAQVRGSELGRPPIFQAGHAGSIPVTRSNGKRPGHSLSTVSRSVHARATLRRLSAAVTQLDTGQLVHLGCEGRRASLGGSISNAAGNRTASASTR